jgi:hypothetical protein
MSDPSKKRKRNADGSKVSSKKYSIEDVSVSLVEGVDEWTPIIGERHPAVDKTAKEAC